MIVYVRVVRVFPSGRVVKTLPLPAVPAKGTYLVLDDAMLAVTEVVMRQVVQVRLGTQPPYVQIELANESIFNNHAERLGAAIADGWEAE